MIDLLETATAKSYLAGTHRIMTPAETVARLRPYLRGVGITRVANVTGLDDLGIPIVQAIRPNSRALSVSQGKGIDLDAARASAIMESIEHWAAGQVRCPVFWGTHEDMARRGAVVDVATLPRLARTYVPSARILWTEACELTTGRTVAVPYEMVHLDFTLPLPPGSGFFLGGSNGLASGNHRVESLTHAMAELIERDALTLFYQLPLEQQQARRVDLETVDEDSCRGLLERYARAGVDLAVWDATSDVGIAVFLCSAIERQWNPLRPIGPARGSGCHPDREIALFRALTEAAQSRLARIVGTRDDLQPTLLEENRSLAKHLQHRAQLTLPGRPSVRFSEVPSVRTDTFEEEIRMLSARLERAGVGPTLVLDLSHPEIPASVVRAIIPGLEGTSENPRYQPGARARRALAAGVQ